MDLRTEKEKQRSVLIKLKEISSVDDSFSNTCQEKIHKIGFVLPTANRLTSTATSAKRTNAGRSGQAINSAPANQYFRASTNKTDEEAPIHAGLNQISKPVLSEHQKQSVGS